MLAQSFFSYPVYAVLHNVRSAYNVGSLLRTADAAGVRRVFLTGFTPAPVDRFGRVRSDVAKTALGAERSVSWAHHKTFTELHKSLAAEGVRCTAVEQNPRSESYTDFILTHPTAFVFGNEVEGLKEDVLRFCDHIIEIPMAGGKESLNVSVSAGVVLFSVRDGANR